MKADLPALWAEAPSTLRRDPTSVELAGGFPCGPLDLQLFNELMFRLGQVYREAAYVVTQSGQTPNAGNTGQLWAAIKSASPTDASLWHTGVASGTASALLVPDLKRAITAYPNNNDQIPCLIVSPFIVATGATINIGGLGAIPIRRADDTPVQFGDVIAGDLVGTIRAGAFRLLSLGRAEVQRITLNPILWVRPDGNDSNDGTSNDSAHAFATLAGALNRGTSQFNFASSALTIRLGVPAAYASPQYLPTATGRIEIVGDEGNKGGYIISGAGSSGQGSLQTSGILNLRGLTVQNTGSNSHTLVAADKAVVNCFNVDLVGTQTTNGYHAYGAGGSITLATGCTIRGNAGAACWGDGGGQVVVNVNANLAIVGNPTFTQATIVATNQGRFTLLGGASVTGSATGLRYIANNYSIISTNGAGPNAFPGTDAGTLNNSIYS